MEKPIQTEKENPLFLWPFAALWKMLSLVLTIRGEGDIYDISKIIPSDESED